MKDSKLTVLNELLEDCRQEKKIIDDKIQNNLNSIAEIDAFLNSIRNSEETGFKVFSPRNSESIYKDKIQKVTAEKNKLCKENEDYLQKSDNRKKKIENLSFLIKEDEKSDQNMNLALLDVQEKERIRIAKELHDSSLQNLSHLVHMIELSSLYIDEDPIRAKLELASCSQSLKQVINEIRDTIFNLRPMTFDDLGFKQCIENFIDNLKQKYKDCEIISCVDDILFDIVDLSKKDTFNLCLVSLYRVIQEAMINSMKHSGGNRLELYVKRNIDTISIRILDNGRGFSIDESDHSLHEEHLSTGKKHFGISIMKERIYLLGGQLEISSQKGQGTKIFITVPLP